MSEATKKIAGVAGSAILLTSLGATGALAYAETPDTAADGAAAEVAAEQAAGQRQKAEVVQGEFTFSQAILTPTALIEKAMNASQYLCGALAMDNQPGDPEAWEVAVSGDVDTAFVATLGELAETGEYHMTMGCACAGNPEDGLANINAEVTGVTIAHILERSGASLDANTIVFTSADGYEVALPLAYVAQRASMLVYAVNGGELADTVGGTNQLWLGSTSARYFVRNVEKISIESREVAPPVPGSAEAGDTYANVPNISVVYGGAAQ